MVQAEALFDFGLKVIRGVRDMELNGLNVFGRAYLPASSAALSEGYFACRDRSLDVRRLRGRGSSVTEVRLTKLEDLF